MQEREEDKKNQEMPPPARKDCEKRGAEKDAMLAKTNVSAVFTGGTDGSNGRSNSLR